MTATCGAPRVPTLLSALGTKLGHSYTPPSSWSAVCQTSLQNPRKHFTYYYQLIIKDTNEQSDGEVCKARSGRVPSTRTFGMHHHPSIWMCLPIQKLSEPCCLGFFFLSYSFTEVLLCRYDRLNHWLAVTELSLQPLPSPQRSGGEAKSCSPLGI